jgi:hypothetical protein
VAVELRNPAQGAAGSVNRNKMRALIVRCVWCSRWGRADRVGVPADM